MADEKESMTIGMFGSRQSGQTKWMIDSILELAKEYNLTIDVVSAEPIEVSNDQIAAVARALFPHYTMPDGQYLLRKRVRDALEQAKIPVAPEGV